MQGNAWGCVALREKLLQVRLFKQYSPETFVRRLVWVVWVVSLPPLKLSPGFVPRRFPDVGAGDAPPGFREYLFDVGVNGSTPIRSSTVRRWGRLRTFGHRGFNRDRVRQNGYLIRGGINGAFQAR